MMELYIVIDNNHDTYGDFTGYQEWTDGVYSSEEIALKRKHECELEYLKLLLDLEEENEDENEEVHTAKEIKHFYQERLFMYPVIIKKYCLDIPDGKIK